MLYQDQIITCSNDQNACKNAMRKVTVLKAMP